jgi:S1-C subfamily serine protease
MEKIVISTAEIAETASPAEQPARLEPKLPPPVPWWARVSMSPLVLVLPVLCLVTLVLRLAMRGLPPRTRYAWLAFLSSLLMVSGILTSAATVVAVSLAPLPSIVGEGLSEFDERTQFPALPASSVMSAREVSEQLKPLVVVISPAARSWFSRREAPSASFGAGVLLHAGTDGYLIATARHVIDGSLNSIGPNRALVASSSGTWSGADVIARHNKLDLLLLWVRRQDGTANFELPIAPATDVEQGQNIYVIGHPQGLRFTLSTGIVSRTDKDVFQISAPVSPGNSGGPMFDDRGHLAGIVTSMVDKSSNPNAENLNFAVRADAMLNPSGWNFLGDGRKRLDDVLNAQKTQH